MIQVCFDPCMDKNLTPDEVLNINKNLSTNLGIDYFIVNQNFIDCMEAIFTENKENLKYTQ